MSAPMTESMRRSGLMTAVVVAHALVVLAHGAAHRALGVSMSASANLFILVVIVAGPLVGLILILSGREMAGRILLGTTMAGALIFGALNHFVAAGPDHVSHLAPGPWRPAFQATAGALAALELLGTALVLRRARLSEAVR